MNKIYKSLKREFKKLEFDDFGIQLILILLLIVLKASLFLKASQYKQLIIRQRYQIEALLETEISKSEIAKIIGVNPCTDYRELSRNIAKRGSLQIKIGKHKIKVLDSYFLIQMINIF